MSGVFTVFLVICYLIAIEIQINLAELFLSRRRVELWLDAAVPRWSKTILNIFSLYGHVDIRLDTSMVSKLPPHAIVLSNHQSYMDIIALFVILRQHPLRFVGKNSLSFGFPGVSKVLKLGRHAFVRQSGDPMGAVLAVKRFSKRVHAMGQWPVIFPEGTRSRDGSLGEFKTGGLRTIAEGSPLPFVVVAVDGGHGLRDLGSMTQAAKTYYRARVVSVLPPVAGKKEMAAMLEVARNSIDEQIKRWESE